MPLWLQESHQSPPIITNHCVHIDPWQMSAVMSQHYVNGWWVEVALRCVAVLPISDAPQFRRVS
jgi:hypothetical protein